MSKQTFCFIVRKYAHQAIYKRYFLPTVKIKDFNVMVDGKKFFDQLVFRKNLTGQGVDYATDSLLHYVYFKNYNEMIVIDSCKQQARNTGQKAIPQINLREI